VRRCPRMSAASDTPDERQSEVIIRGHNQRSSSEVITEVFIRGHHIPPSEMRSNLMRDAIRGHHQRSSSEVITHLRARCAQTCDRVHLQSTCRVRSYRRRGGQRGT
jgi:hypothetical protein